MPWRVLKPRHGPGIAAERGAGAVFVVLIILAAVSLLIYLYNPGRRPVEGSRAVRAASAEGGLSGLEALPVRPSSSSVPSGSGRLDEALRAIKAGETHRAVVLLRLAHRDSPGDTEVSEALALALNNSALEEYKRGDYVRARDLLVEAATLSGDAAVRVNLSSVLVKTGDLDRAASVLESLGPAAGVGSRLKGVYVMIGNRSLEGGRTAAAAESYEKALKLDPTDKSLRDTLKRIGIERGNERGLTLADAVHFRVRYEGGENAVTGHLIGLLLEEAYVKVGRDFDYYPSEKIEALLYTRERFRDVTGSPSWSSAIYDGKIKIPAGGIVEKTRALEAVIFHEYTHALTHRLAAGRAPVWLDEGLAQYEEGKRSAGSADRLARIAGSGQAGLRSIEGSFMGYDAERAHRAYLLSLSATEYIIREFGLDSTTAILKAIGSGASLEDAIFSVLYLSYGDLEKSWLEALVLQ